MLKTALIVDDSRLARLTLKRLLTQYDIEVAEAEGVVDAERWIATNVLPDLVFMDVMMPEIDGFEGLQRLREEPDTKDIPVIMYSGDISEEARKKARDKGATGYLPKPADANRLDHLLNALSKRTQNTPSQVAAAEAEIAAANRQMRGFDSVSTNERHQARGPIRQQTQQPVTQQPIAPQPTQPVIPQAIVAEVPEELTRRLEALEIQLKMAAQSANTEIPEALTKRLNELETQLSTSNSNLSKLDVTADIERQQRDVIYLQRQVAKSEQMSKTAIIVGILGLLIGIAAVIRSLL